MKELHFVIYFYIISFLTFVLSTNDTELNKNLSKIMNITNQKNNTGKKHNKLLLISLDGFRHDYVTPKRHLTNFYKLFNKGVRSEVMNAFVTKTLPNHFSLATGLYPESHGIVANTMYDPSLNESFDFTDWSDSKKINKWFGSLSPIWVSNSIAKKGKAGVIRWPGSPGLFQNVTADKIIPFETKLNLSSSIATALSWLSSESDDYNLVLLYNEILDEDGHQFGPDSSRIVEDLLSVNIAVGQLLKGIEKANLGEKLNVIITSDHGMETTKSNQIIFLSDYVNTTLFSTYGTSPALNIFPLNETSTEEIYSALYQAHQHLHVYHRADIPAHFHYSNNERILPLFVYTDPGWNIAVDKKTNPTFSIGNHGYSNEYSSMHPIFMAYGPDFKENYYIESEMINIVDIYPMMCYLLGIECPANNGSLIKIQHLLRYAPPSTLAKNTTGHGIFKEITHFIYSNQPHVYIIASCLTFVLIMVLLILVVRGCRSRNRFRYHRTTESNATSGSLLLSSLANGTKQNGTHSHARSIVDGQKQPLLGSEDAPEDWNDEI